MTGMSIVRTDPGLSWWQWRYAIPPEDGRRLWWLGTYFARIALPGGIMPAAALWVWALHARQTAAPIFHMILQLRPSVLLTTHPLRPRISQVVGALLGHSAAFAMPFAAYSIRHAFVWVMLAPAVPLAEGKLALMRPQLLVTPMQLGFRQLLVSALR